MGGITHALQPLLRPRSVAVIGASRTPGKSGYNCVRNLRRFGFSGSIYPVNQEGGEIEGIKCFTSIADVPGVVDCAITVVPASQTAPVVARCAEKGVRSVIVGATGFAESDRPDGIRWQDEIVAIHRKSGMRVLGPNTNGIFNNSDHVSIGYNTSHGEPIPDGGLSIASHSGALFNGIARRLRQTGLGLSKFISLGNECDLNMLDFLEYFIEDEPTRVIGLIIEAIADGKRFRKLALRAHERGRPIIALKVGRSRLGAGAALAHSTRLAGSARAYDALFRECGVASVPSLEALVGGAALLLDRDQEALACSPNLLCVSSSGAGGGILVDLASDRGIPLAGDETGQFPSEVSERLAAMPGIGRLRNPIDTGVLGGQHTRLTDIFEILRAGGIDGPVALSTHALPQFETSRAIADTFIERKKRTRAPAVLYVPGGLGDEVEGHYRDAGIPVFYDSAAAFDALKCHFATLARPQDALIDEVPVVGVEQAVTQACEFAKRNAAGSVVALSELDSATILRAAGIPIVESHIVTNIAQTVAASRACGFPVVLKALPPGVVHKAAAGLVALGLADEAAVSEAYARLEATVTGLGHRRDGTTFVVQPMRRSGLEVIAGVSHEPGLGHFLVAGIGGIHAEIFDQVIVLPIPLAPSRIEVRIKQSPLGKLLGSAGAGISPSALVDSMTQVLDRLQKVVANAADVIHSIDINPLIAGNDGLVAVDALVVVKS